MPTHPIYRIVFFASVLLPASFLLGCKKTPPVAAAKPPEVAYVHPTSEKVRRYEDYTGRTESIHRVEIRARVTSELREVHFKDGSDVVQGQKLFDLDSRQFEAELKRVEATLAQAEATLTQKEKALKRARELRQIGTNTPEDLEIAQSDQAVAKATRDLAIANKQSAQLNVEFCHITSPISGRISRKMIDEGNQVTANVTLLTTVVATNPMYADFDVDEQTVLGLRRLLQRAEIMSALQTRARLDVGTADEEGFSLSGILEFSNNEFDAGTGTLRLRVTIENPDMEELIGPIISTIDDSITAITGISGNRDIYWSKRRLLSPGMFVRIRFWIGEAQPALLVPEEALISDQGIRHLFVLKGEDEVEYRPVQIGLQQGDMRVIEKGVSTSDRIIVSGLQRVRAGIKVAATPKAAKKTDEQSVSSLDSSGKKKAADHN